MPAAPTILFVGDVVGGLGRRTLLGLLLQAGGVLPGSPVTLPSQVQVVTPYNEPSAYGAL